ncbi:tetratricopeptide repeat protein [Streptomyces sp. WM6386]|uniref:tetratricopeptide repeat protein n=1 Tax=Streptomyces sp. WM6386 TaxID=1415558 RepID=UPI0006197B34|nr:tetratricopeptide repeat protein [Streptomyces sp. WM6386]KKD09778.1 regulator [Streptomyces sp. WM6386]
MMDLISVGAISAVLTTVWQGMGSEAGKSLWVSAGGLVRRIAGREVAAPATPAQLDGVARLVHERVREDPRLADSWLLFARTVPAAGASAVLRRPSLPNAPRYFTDREEALRLLDKEASRPHDGRPRLALLHGREGIGTSTLALHWGWRQISRFPDGQPYVDLRSLGPEAAVGQMLRQLGLRDEEIPLAARDRAELLRQCLADRRMLLVLDHARSLAQIDPLLTSAPGVFTIVVARQPLAGLGALTIPVGPLANRDARQMLERLVGTSAVTAARSTLPTLLDRCAGSPYALRAAALRLATPPARPQVAPAVPESDPVRAAAEDSYRLLTPGAARLYRLAGLRDWPALDSAAAARAADVPSTEATRLLDELVAALLVERQDTGRHRYRPAVRAHAEGMASTVDGIPQCSAAVARVVEGYRALALGAARAALPQSWRVPRATPGPPDPGAGVAAPPAQGDPGAGVAAPGPYAGPGAAVAALAAEAPSLVEAVLTAEEYRDWDSAVLIGQALWPLQLKAGQFDVLLPALRAAARVADERFPGTRTAGALHFQLAHCLMESARWDEAETEALAAVRDERAAGHARGHASAVELLGLLRLRQWRPEEAYACFEESIVVYGTIGPGELGFADLPRARALLDRHRGHALGQQGRRQDATELLERALRFFRDSGEAYNTARTLTDLASLHVDAGAVGTALPLIDEALAALADEKAEHHVRRLRVLRERCVRPE